MDERGEARRPRRNERATGVVEQVEGDGGRVWVVPVGDGARCDRPVEEGEIRRAVQAAVDRINQDVGYQP